MLKNLAKRIWFFLVLCSLLSVLQAGEKGLLFEVTRPGQPVHYLFGTMHSDDSRVVALLDRLKQPFAEVEQVALEILPDMNAMVQVSVAMLLPPDQKLSELLGSSLYRRAVKAAGERGLPEVAVQRMRPWALAITLGTPELTGDAMDQLIYKQAQLKGKKLVALETPLEQMALFEELPGKLQIRLLEQVLDQQDEFGKQLEELTQAYLDQDLDRLQELSLAYEAAGDSELMSWFRRKLILDRNRRMLERLLPIFDQDATLVAVGALHLSGREGLVNLLRQAGYRVEARF